MKIVHLTCFIYLHSLSSCYVLSQLSVLHHSSLNCLRRMLLIVATSVYFRTPLSEESMCGLLFSLVGFGAFTYYRNLRQTSDPKKKKDSNV